MSTATTALLLLLAVTLSGFAGRMLRGIPLPLVQIAFGAGLTWWMGGAPPLEPEFFLFFFIPPLLFADARRYPKRELFRLRRPIVALALNLVIWSVVGAGYFIDWLVPTIPLPVAFALAAVLSPTDPVAVSAITSATPVPRTMMLILEGEALLNDATGLVCLRFAIAAMMTGSFSLMAAAGSFAVVALGGVAIGIAFSVGIGTVQRLLVDRGGEEPGTQILVTLLQPFAAYLLAEHLHVSGILAAVAAGLALPFIELSRSGLAETRISGDAVWRMLQFALNGAIFVLLGQQIPGIFAGSAQVLAETHAASAWSLAYYVLAITAAMMTLRFAFIVISSYVVGAQLRRKGRAVFERPQLRHLVAMSVAGVRGAITLVGVLTLPLALPDGSPFPSRATAIYLACGVILISLVAASVLLPLLLNGTDVISERDHSEERIRARLATAAARAVESADHGGKVDPEIFLEAAATVVSAYRQVHSPSLFDIDVAAYERKQKLKQTERDLHVIGLRAAREELLQQRRKRELSDVLAAQLMRELDLAEMQLAHPQAH